MIFKRRRRDEDDPDLEVTDLDEDEFDDDDDNEPAEPVRPRGPWDVDDLEDAGDAKELPRVDLGGVRVAIPDGCEMRVDVDQESGSVRSVLLVRGPSTLQLSAFAAPRTEGIWEEVRGEIAASLAQQQGTASTVEGPFGPELAARVPGQVMAPDGRVVTALQPARFLGVDGPRWFLRAVLAGPAASDAAQAAPLEEAFRQIVVVRGKDPMAVRDPLPLRLPAEITEQEAVPGEGDIDDAALPAMPERGPEITEVR